MLVSFAASVLGVRLFLFLTGYPQVGGGTLHIAHALWRGLLLFAASLLPLLVVNRWALTWSALLSGAGVGLFIDEVGNFITQDNDYFFSAAAPIAYAVFLLSVLVLLRARRPRSRTDRAEPFRALDQLEDALTGELDVAGHRGLERRLRRLSGRVEQPRVRNLANTLLIVVRSNELRAFQAQPSAIARHARRFSALAGHWVTEHRLRVTIVVGLVTLGAFAVSDLAVIAAVGIDLADGTDNDIGTTRI